MPTPDAALNSFSAVIITGGSSGIGKSFIELCSKMRPGLAFCNLSRRAPVITGTQLNLRHVACDLSKPADVESAVSAIGDFLAREAPAGRILLVNNSGFGVYGLFPEPGIAQQLEMVDVNVRAVLHLTGALMPAMKARGGVIVTVASTAAFQPTEFFRRAGLAEGSVPDALGETSEQVVMASLRAIAAGKAMVVSGWKNKLQAAVVTKLPKPLAARLAAAVLARTRKSRMKP